MHKVFTFVSAFALASTLTAYGATSPAGGSMLSNGTETSARVAEETIKVKGVVLDESGMPIIGANIRIKDTSKGTVTDMDGKFVLDAPEGAVLVVSYIGYTPQEVKATASPMTINLSEDTQTLSEVVVTALGIKREKKALGYAVQDVKSDRLTQAGDADVMSGLQGKVAGVSINSSGGGLGASTRIDIRGASSLSDNNEPLWVVDGVPFDNGNSNNSNGWGGTSRAGGAFDLNPDDIESISVLKGANAAALYGERGGNGVIVVTTKKGSRKQTLGISYSGSVTFSEAAYMLDRQNRYGQGVSGNYINSASESWGPEMVGQTVTNWTGEQIALTPQGNLIKDFCQTGVEQSHNLSLTGGNDKGSFRLSIGHSDMDGLFENHNVKKTNVDLRADYDINPWLNVDTKVAFFRTQGQNRPEVGAYSYMSYFNAMPAGIRTSDLKPGYNMVAGEHKEKLYTTVSANARNPYFLLNQYVNNDDKNRTFGYIAGNFKILPGLTAKLKYGMDYYGFRSQDGYLYADGVDPNRPNYNTSQINFRETNFEGLVSYSGRINEDFDFNVNLGANDMRRKTNELRGTSGKLASEDTYFLGAGSNIKSSESIIEQETRSIYGFGQVGFRNYLYMDVTARNDWSSTLTAATGNYDNSYFYPSVSVSGVISQMTQMPEWVTYGKVRASVAQVGKATDPYMTSQFYSLESTDFDLTAGNVPSQAVIKDLKPELSTSWEVGTEWKFLNNRIGLDFTFYNEETKNQILAVEAVQSSGYSSRLINAGLIRNRGVELMITTVPVKTKDLTVTLDFNFSKNKGTLEELIDKNDPNALKEFEFGTGSGVWAVEGGNLGDIRGKKYLRDSETGQILVGDDGLPLRTDNNVKIGNLQADWTGSISLGAEYKGFYASALIDIRQGGDIVSSSEASATSAGTAARTDFNNRMPFFVEGVTADGQVNTTMVTAQQYFQNQSSITEEFLYDASYAKMKELVFGYRFPKHILNKIPGNVVHSLRASFVARNLFYLYKDTPGTTPDGSAYSTSYAQQAYDSNPVPNTRTFGFSLNVGF